MMRHPRTEEAEAEAGGRVEEDPDLGPEWQLGGDSLVDS
jgi:hypothetical protein